MQESLPLYVCGDIAGKLPSVNEINIACMVSNLRHYVVE